MPLTISLTTSLLSWTRTDLQIDGAVEEVAGIEPLDKKFESFGFEVLKIDGHDFESDCRRLSTRLKQCKGQALRLSSPRTVKGKGVSFMENQVGWHGTAPNKEQYEQATAELEAEMTRLEGEC